MPPRRSSRSRRTATSSWSGSSVSRSGRSCSRFPPDCWTSPDEDALTCAERELYEETGYRSRDTKFLGGLYLSPGTTDDYVHLFVGWTDDAPMGPSESGIQVERRPFTEMVASRARREGPRRHDHPRAAARRRATILRVSDSELDRDAERFLDPPDGRAWAGNQYLGRLPAGPPAATRPLPEGARDHAGRPGGRRRRPILRRIGVRIHARARRGVLQGDVGVTRPLGRSFVPSLPRSARGSRRTTPRARSSGCAYLARSRIR